MQSEKNRLIQCIDHFIPKLSKIPFLSERDSAPQEGLEPTTLRLTAECSAIELLRQKVESLPPYLESGGDLLSRAVSSQVPSALKVLTSVFGMGTGGTPSPLPPETVSLFGG